MHTRRRYLAVFGTVIALAGCRDDGQGGGDGDGSVETATGTTAGTLTFSTPAFEAGETIPERFTGVGADVPQEQTVLDGAQQGTNDLDDVGYRGPLPPEGDGPHTYRFTMYAVGAELDRQAGSRRGELESGLDGDVVDTHRVTGEFER
jgi:hypothetical protein